jgi:hypothetical protein
MRSTRSLASTAVILLVTAASHAGEFTFTGKFTSNRGKIINIPMVGNTPCAPITFMSGPGNGGTNTYASHMIVRGANTQPQGPVTPDYQGHGRDLRCVKHAAGKKIATDGMVTSMGKGGGFVLPANAFTKPLPPYVRAIEVKYAPPIEQLATSFRVTGPATNPIQLPRATMADGMNTAPPRVFKQGAWQSQTGRRGADFTWCPASPANAGKGGPCTNINQAGPNLIVRYSHGVNAFGGTIGYIVSSGPNPSSIAFGLGGGAVAFQILGHSGSQATGRGYADFRTTHFKGGPIWGVHSRNYTDGGPYVGPQKLITMVAFPIGTFADATEFAWGFPLTTGHVLVRNYVTRTTTFTAQGGDSITAMGARNISLVAGGVAVARQLAGAADQMEPRVLSMMLPEPAATLQWITGVATLLAIARWRARRVP